MRKIRNYEAVRYLGAGATAETWLCRDLRHGARLVAVKRFSEGWSTRHPENIERELNVLSGLSHPYIASVLDFGREGSRFFLVSEFVAGRDLLSECASKRQFKFWLLVQLLEALDYLYARNIVHLDLKPANVLVQPETEQISTHIKLIDFGLAAMSLAAGRIGSVALGTPPFTAPELALRRGFDVRSDLYSVGVLAYAALSGRLPFSGNGAMELLNQQLQSSAPPLQGLLPQIGPQLSGFVDRLLVRDPQRRFQSPAEALLALQNALGDSFSTASLVPSPIFEDPDLLFRNAFYEELAGEFATAGRWAIAAEAGMGKSFLARWLQRNLWKRRQPVQLLHGEELPLLETNFLPETTLIIDDAEHDSVEPWVRDCGCNLVVLFGEALEGCRAPEWRRIPLPPLSREEVTMALTRGLGPVATEAAARWWRMSQGNPLRLVEFGRMLCRRGVIRRHGSRWTLDEAKFLSSSPTWQDVLDTDANLLAILQLSQVALDPEALALWSRLSVAEVREKLTNWLREGRLERKVESGAELYRNTASPLTTRPPALGREATYAWLEGLFARGQYREGAEAFVRCYPEDPPSDRQGRLLLAKLYCGCGEYERVSTLLESPWLETLSPADQALGHELLGKSRLFLAHYAAARESLEQALDLYSQDDEADGQSRALMHLGILAQRGSDFALAGEFYRRALEQARRSSNSGLLLGAVELNWANLCADSADFEEAERRYRLSLEHLELVPQGALRAQALLNAASLSFFLGKSLQAEDRCREALRMALEHRYFLTQGRALLLLAMLDEQQGNPSRQRRRLDEAVRTFAAHRLEFEELQARIQRAYYNVFHGNTAEAERDAAEALRRAGRISAPDLVAQAQLALGKTLRQDEARRDEARGCLEKALAHFDGERNLQVRWECEWEMGELARGARRLPEARRYYRQSLESLETLLNKLPVALREPFLRDGKKERIQEALASLEGTQT
ncbi:MAG: protein kinase [Deltaproteobacteria bacterium]|nr:protein kinase [Deltaproteobacteria bacterium]